MKKVGERTTSLVNSVWHGAKGSLNNRTSYSYDNNGNITSICENGKEKVSYGYGSLNRLIRETSGAVTTTYNYDRGGNILSKTIVSGGATTENVYEYGITGNRDRLLKYNGLNFAYDVMGNPTTYKGKALIWEKGRQLKSYDGVTYTYDAFGRRITKTASAVTSQYVYGNNKLLKEAKGATTIEYIYGQGIAGIAVNGVKHVFGTNVQGDVTHIYDTNGNLEATYTYDAWGNHTVHNPDGTINTSSTFIGNINPIRYRGYCYDTETGLYYLNSRYYDPEIGRFLNADDISYIEPDTINGLNLYAYCMNNPVMHTDSTGTSIWSDIGNWFKNNWQWVAGAAIVVGLGIAVIATGGAAAGVAGFIFAGAFKGAVIGAATGAVIGGVIGGLSGGDGWSWDGALAGAKNGFFSGALSGAIMGAATNAIRVGQAARMWAPSSTKRGYTQMVSHYKDHVICEGQKLLAKNIVSYTAQAKSFYAVNSASAYRIGVNAFKIAGTPGGIFTANGMIKSFWYILL